MSILPLPTVIPNFDGQIVAVEEAIRQAAMLYKFYYSAPIEPAPVDKVPDVVYALASHFRARGFNCVYDGDLSELVVSWNYPNMTDQDVANITRAFPGMIASLGRGFTAPLLYLCMTNGADLRQYNLVTLRRQVARSIENAAILGNTNITLAFPGVPAPTVINLFQQFFDELAADGFAVSYSSSMGAFVIAFDDGTDLLAFEGSSLEIGDLE